MVLMAHRAQVDHKDHRERLATVVPQAHPEPQETPVQPEIVVP